MQKNSASFLRDDLEYYSESFSQQGWHDPIPFVLRGDIQRRSLEAIEFRNSDSDLPELSDRSLLAFKNLVRAHNFVITLHPEIRKIDENLREGIRVEHADPMEKLRSISKFYKSKKEIDDKSRNTLVFLEQKIVSDRDTQKAKFIAFGFLGNFIQATSAWVWENRKAIAAGTFATGGAIVTAIKWMLANEAWVLSTFPVNSSIGALVRAALEIAKTLPIL